MTAFAGFRDLSDYLESRMRVDNLSERALTDALGKGHTYIHMIKKGKFKPSKEACDEIADFFNDDHQLVRVLAGLEDPPKEDDQDMAAIRTVYQALPKGGRKELLEYAQFLRDKYHKKANRPSD